MTHNQHHHLRARPRTDTHRRPRYSGPVLLTVDEACRQIRISRWTLYRLINRGSIRTIKVGSRRLVPLTAIDEMVQQLQDESAPS